MQNKKRVTILVIIALILAITAIALNSMDSEVSTTRSVNQDHAGGGKIGVEIEPPQVEDKLAEEETPQQ
jgi:hypothetical protein